MKSIVFGVAPYLNAAPLAEGLYGREDVEVLHDVPSALLEDVKSGRADVGLMPIVDRLFDPELTAVDGMGVCADGRVRSVLLRCRRPLAEVGVVAADAASHTSNLLVQVIMRDQLGVEAVVKPLSDATAAGAEVVIGDRALTTAPGPFGEYDLAEEWKALTGLPFVFAVWTLRRDNPRAADVARIAEESLAAGRAAQEDIARRYAERLKVPLALCREYLASCVYHRVGARETGAIEEFLRRLQAHGLEPSARGRTADVESP